MLLERKKHNILLFFVLTHTIYSGTMYKQTQMGRTSERSTEEKRDVSSQEEGRENRRF